MERVNCMSAVLGQIATWTLIDLGSQVWSNTLESSLSFLQLSCFLSWEIYLVSEGFLGLICHGPSTFSSLRILYLIPNTSSPASKEFSSARLSQTFIPCCVYRLP